MSALLSPLQHFPRAFAENGLFKPAVKVHLSLLENTQMDKAASFFVPVDPCGGEYGRASKRDATEDFLSETLV